MSYIKYHIASGHIDLKFVASEEALSFYEEDGYAIMESTDNPFSNYVVNGALTPRESISLDRVVYNAGIGETITVTGLPSGVWVKCDNQEPFLVENGAVTVQQPGNNDVMLMHIVGKSMMNNSITLLWSDLGALKTKSKGRIDKSAEAARSRVITVGSGQAMTYIRKAEAARLFIAGVALTDAQTLRLQDEATRLSITIEEAAQQIVMIADQWEAIDAQIDSMRLSSKAAIDAAISGTEVDDVMNGIVWPV
jgi:hypothetical protein